MCGKNSAYLGGVFFSGFDRDTAYWNQYYKNKPDINFPSLFAEEVGKYIKAPGELLDLGCGNGRDSIYFGSLGLHVTGVDASDVAIAELCAKYQNEENICFLCADFVCAPIIYARQYDYCYSRFSIHAINDEQENDLIASVHQSLKDNGKFFIEVRSVNDELCGKGEMVGRNSYIYEGHFRRFVVKQELEQKLVNAGFCLEYSEESRGFAPYGETDPPVIRIIAKRKY